MQDDQIQHKKTMLNSYTPVFVEKMLNSQEVQQMRASLLTNIVTSLVIAAIYGIYMLAGEYLTTFVFTFIFAISLSSIKTKLLEKIQEFFIIKQDNTYTHVIFQLYTLRFSIIFKLILKFVQIITSLSKIWETFKTIFQKTCDATIIPNIFILYVLGYKLQLYVYIFFMDLIFWVIIDIARSFMWALKKLTQKAMDLTQQSTLLSQLRFIKKFSNQATQTTSNKNVPQKMKIFIRGLEQSAFFDSFLFFTLTASIFLILAISFLLSYNDAINYKEDITPVIQKLNLTELGVAQYLKPDYILQQLEGSYISPQMALQLRKYFESDSDDNHDFIKIFYGDQQKYMRKQLTYCKGSWICKTKVVIMNYDLLNSEIYEYVENGFQYFKTILPEIQTTVNLILSFLMSAFAGSMSYLFKFMLFQQGVMYLMNQSKIGLSDFQIFDLDKHFRDKIVNDFKSQINGVFVALTQIFVNHFMLSYVILDIIGIQLSFILSVIVAFLSLTQIISPGVFFGVVLFGWYIAGSYIQQYEQTLNISFVSVLISFIVFFVSSTSTYTTSLNKHLGDPFWTGISVILGYISFQWKGIIYGPILIGFIRALGNLVGWYLEEKRKVPAHKKTLSDVVQHVQNVQHLINKQKSKLKSD